ncbi:uncharacterized protein [Amphiura filiformis]|uniref:uncharacterized protein n=1 Tax=Amphiura filiformis TaxID=82378 RepID=UPI003B218FA5
MEYASFPREKLTLVKRIAQGSFGTVYKALLENQEVAAKRVETEEGHRELKFLIELDHPNIVKLIGIVDNGVDVDIILEFCDGGSLRSYLNAHRGEHLGLRFYDWAKQAGRPIAYLKKMHVVHKDIKSPNYLITSGNILKLCDFGLAKDLDATITSATETASYPWMAPELLRDNILSPTYDIYAYGVVVWELWMTDIPFEDCKVPANLTWRICNNNERPPIPPNCPKPIADLMKQCWQIDWKKRPSMDQVILMLTSAEQSQFIAMIAGPWELEKEFRQDGPGKLNVTRDIAVCPCGDIAVLSDTIDGVCMYSNEGLYKSHLDLEQGMDPGVTPYPSNVTVNADGIIYVTCICYVLMYTAQCVYKGRWVAMSPDNKPSDSENTWLCGLTIDSNGQLLVGQLKSPRYISKHRHDGSHIASIKVNIRPYYLAATSHDTIVISDLNIVQIVDSTGQVLHTLNTYRQMSFCWYPRAVPCYNDIILVCNSDLGNTHEISCFSVSAEYLGSIAVRDRPYGVAISKDNCKLLVGCNDRVVTYAIKSLPIMHSLKVD